MWSSGSVQLVLSLTFVLLVVMQLLFLPSEAFLHRACFFRVSS